MLTVATWNVLAQAYVLPERYAGCAPDDLAAGPRGARVRDRITALLEGSDVLALQEVEPELAAWLAERAEVVLGMRPNGRDGVALASARLALERPATHVSADGRRTWAAADVAGLRVVALHLDPEWSERRLHGAAQARELAADVAAHPDVVLLGDLNSTWTGPTGRALADAGFTAAPTGATAATNGRTRVLDVVAVRGALLAEAAATGLPEPGTGMWLPSAAEPSDHVPVRAVVVPESADAP